jgi:hypothetical protein
MTLLKNMISGSLILFQEIEKHQLGIVVYRNSKKVGITWNDIGFREYSKLFLIANINMISIINEPMIDL